MDGKKDNFISLRDSKMLVCSTSMSFGYTNIRWSKLGNAQWVCTAYNFDDADYAQEGRKVILRFSAGEKKPLWQYIVPMNLKAGPFEKGKEPDALEDGGYKYDKNDSSAPRLLPPKWISCNLGGYPIERSVHRGARRSQRKAAVFFGSNS